MTQPKKSHILKKIFIILIILFALFIACLTVGYPWAEANYRKNQVIEAGLKYALVVQAGKMMSATMGYDYTVPDIKEMDILPYDPYFNGIHINTSLNKITPAGVEITFIFDSTKTLLCQMVADELKTICNNNIVIYPFDLPYSNPTMNR